MPPRQHLSLKTRRRIAADWLVRCGQIPSESRINSLIPYAGQYKENSLYGRLANQLVSNNRIPSKSNLREFFFVNLEADQISSSNTSFIRLHRVELDTSEKVKLAKWVEQQWAESGQSATWSDVGRAHTWTRNQVQATLTSLRREGWLAFDRRPRSLRAGPRLIAAPLEPRTTVVPPVLLMD